jgi:hypothetical protein
MSDADRERRGVVAGFANEKEATDVNQAIDQITELATKLAAQNQARKDAEEAAARATADLITRAIEAAKPALPVVCDHQALRLCAFGIGADLLIDARGALTVYSATQEVSSILPIHVARQLGQGAASAICDALTRAINRALAASASTTR